MALLRPAGRGTQRGIAAERQGSARIESGKEIDMTNHDPNRPASPRPDAPRPGDAGRHGQPVEPARPAADTVRPVRADQPERVSGSEARQGPPGRPVLYVLIAALVLAVLAWAALEFYPRGGPQTAGPAPGERVTTETAPGTTGGLPDRGQPTAGNIPLSAPPGSPEAATHQAPPTGSSAPTSDSAR
jgi:hypothetical protein